MNDQQYDSSVQKAQNIGKDKEDDSIEKAYMAGKYSDRGQRVIGANEGVGEKANQDGADDHCGDYPQPGLPVDADQAEEDTYQHVCDGDLNYRLQRQFHKDEPFCVFARE